MNRDVPSVYDLFGGVTVCCPECEKPVKPTTCAFNNCEWRYKGRCDSDDGTVVKTMEEWRTVGDVYERFEEESKADWFTLFLETRLIDPKRKTENNPEERLAKTQITQDNVCQFCLGQLATDTQKMKNCDHYFHRACYPDSVSCKLCLAVKK